jgi:hypothetical protein
MVVWSMVVCLCTSTSSVDLMSSRLSGICFEVENLSYYVVHCHGYLSY